MSATGNDKIHTYFLSFVDPNYSRSATLFNYHSNKLSKKFIKVSSKWRILIFDLLRIRKVMNSPSIVIVMSPSQKIAPLVRLFLDQKIILDAGWPLTDGLLSRGLTYRGLPKLVGSYFVDLIAFHSANLILVESRTQLLRVSRRFAVPKSRLHVSFTGLNEIAFTNQGKLGDEFQLQKQKIAESPRKINVIFRGSANNESGIDIILGASKALVNEINLIIITNRNRLPRELPANCFVFSFVSEREMQELYKISDVALGQISENSRLKFTIPHKAYEAGYFAKAYITPPAGGISELYSKSAVHFLQEVSVDGLIKALRELYDLEVRSRYEEQISKEYSKKASQKILSSNFDDEVVTVTHCRSL
jgi:hypothetical protein